VLVVCAFLGVRIAYWVTGGKYSLLMLQAWQLLDLKELAAHPFQSVALLHIQPPLFNLFVGSVLRWSPFPAAFTFQVVYLSCGLVLVVSLRLLLIELGFSPAAATSGAFVVALDPVLLSYENTAAYEYPVAMLLVMSALVCARYAKSRNVSTLIWFSVLLTVIVLTRALLHPAWLIASLALLIWFARPHGSMRWLVVAFVIPVVLVGGWMLKNQVLFGDPTLSSWFGMNLGRGVVAPMPRHDTNTLISEGRMSPAARIPPLSRYSAYAPYFGPCHSTFRERVLTAQFKRNRSSNFNAQCYLRVYSDAQRNAIHAVVNRPGVYLGRRWGPFATHYFHDLAPGLGATRQDSILQAFEHASAPVLVTVTAHIDDRDWTTPLFPHKKPYPVRVSLALIAATLLVIGRGIVSIRFGKRTVTPAQVTWIYIGLTVAYVTVISILTEFGENSRFRVLVDPILLGVLAAQLVDGARWLVAHRGSDR
jgi:hypothetical protein